MNNNVGTLNFHFGSNFGALMVAFSLNRTIAKLGFPCETINYVPNNYELNKNFEGYRNKFIPSSLFCDSPEVIEKYSKKYSRIVVGSDQIFRSHHNFRYMLKWAHGNKTFISYAASFGIDSFTGNFFERRQARKLLSRFDALSVREASGIDIMKNTFGLNAIQTLDPTLLLNPEDYQDIIDSESCVQPSKYVGVMFLDDEHWDEFKTSAIYSKLSSQGYEIVNIVKDKHGEFRSVAQWLSYIKHSSLMITDSFHGTVFSTIYRKQFITHSTKGRGNTRIDSLCKTLSIPISRFYDHFSKTDDTYFDTEIDFTLVWKRIEEERVVSLKFLKDALKIEPKYKEFIPYKRERLSIPIISIEEREHDKRLLGLGFIPLVKITKDEQLYLFEKIPLRREKISHIKSLVRQTIKKFLRR